MKHFPQDVVDAVLEHMNTDHADDSLIIVQAFGRREAEAARMTGVDSAAGEWAATIDGQELPVRIEWSEPVTERPAIRRAVVDLYERACAQLGMAPREPH